MLYPSIIIFYYQNSIFKTGGMNLSKTTDLNLGQEKKLKGHKAKKTDFVGTKSKTTGQKNGLRCWFG